MFQARRVSSCELHLLRPRWSDSFTTGLMEVCRCCREFTSTGSNQSNTALLFIIICTFHTRISNPNQTSCWDFHFSCSSAARWPTVCFLLANVRQLVRESSQQKVFLSVIVFNKLQLRLLRLTSNLPEDLLIVWILCRPDTCCSPSSSSL